MKRQRTWSRVVGCAAAVALAAAIVQAAGQGAAAPVKIKPAKPAPKKPKGDRPFNGKNLDGWITKGPKGRSCWVVGSARPGDANPREFAVSPKGSEMVNAKAHGVDIYSKYVHGDAVIKLEVMVPKGSNSGIYVHGEYEIQVLDSYGREKKPGAGDMGAIYGAAPPKKPKYVKPGEWSKYEIHFQAPRFDAAGKRIAKAKFLKVILNGRVIHQNLEMKGPTPGGVNGKEKPKGPLMYQGNHGPVAFRNIEIFPVKSK